MGKYKITSIEKAESPQGSENNSWYQYVIQNEFNLITSLRAGTKKEVHQFAVEAIKRLNDIYSSHNKVTNYNRPVNENISSIFII